MMIKRYKWDILIFFMGFMLFLILAVFFIGPLFGCSFYSII